VVPGSYRSLKAAGSRAQYALAIFCIRAIRFISASGLAGAAQNQVLLSFAKCLLTTTSDQRTRRPLRKAVEQKSVAKTLKDSDSAKVIGLLASEWLVREMGWPMSSPKWRHHQVSSDASSRIFLGLEAATFRRTRKRGFHGSCPRGDHLRVSAAPAIFLLKQN